MSNLCFGGLVKRPPGHASGMGNDVGAGRVAAAVTRCGLVVATSAFALIGVATYGATFGPAAAALGTCPPTSSPGSTTTTSTTVVPVLGALPVPTTSLGSLCVGQVLPVPAPTSPVPPAGGPVPSSPSTPSAAGPTSQPSGAAPSSAAPGPDPAPSAVAPNSGQAAETLAAPADAGSGGPASTAAGDLGAPLGPAGDQLAAGAADAAAPTATDQLAAPPLVPGRPADLRPAPSARHHGVQVLMVAAALAALLVAGVLVALVRWTRRNPGALRRLGGKPAATAEA